MTECKYKNCSVAQEKLLQEHHIIPKNIILKLQPAQKKGKLYDMVHINGILVYNRCYLCKEHHSIIHNEIINIKNHNEIFFITKSFLKK